MRHTLTLLLVLAYISGISQVEPQLVALVTDESVSASEPAVAETLSLERLISFSEGFTDSSFHHHLALNVTEDHRLSMETDFPRTLQYSISNVEGIIFRKGKFYGSGLVNLSSLRDGSYAVYFFAGNKIVRALMIEHRRSAM